ncbi:MAG TPA: DUF1569 domain-containing protein [Flavobacteriaceae bacterium]|nr:DUF1569 domain-containing protein [Flavobacteriaceae bacterium]
MKNLFHQEAAQEILQRIEKLTPESQALWGKMDVAQMLTHCGQVTKVPLQKITLAKPPFAFRMVFKLFKSVLYNDKPWKQGIPTAREFVISNPQDFSKAKNELVSLIEEFRTLEGKSMPKHPTGITLTPEQWGKAQYKHLDHHLRQFGC